MKEDILNFIQKFEDKLFGLVFEQPESKSRTPDKMQVPGTKLKPTESLKIC